MILKQSALSDETTWSGFYKPGELVEVSYTWLSGPPPRTLLGVYPALAESIGVPKGDVWHWHIECKPCLSILDETLVTKKRLEIGLLEDEEFKDFFVRSREPEYPFVSTELPIGTIGMVINLVELITNEKDISRSVNPSKYYIILCTDYLDVIKGGFYLLKESAVIKLNPSKEAGIKNFIINHV